MRWERPVCPACTATRAVHQDSQASGLGVASDPSVKLLSALLSPLILSGGTGVGGMASEATVCPKAY